VGTPLSTWFLKVLRRYRRAVGWQRLGGHTKLDATEVRRRWRYWHMILLRPWPVRRWGAALRLRGVARTTWPGIVSVVIRARLAADPAGGQTFTGWLRPSLPTHVKLAVEAAIVPGGWIVVLFDAGYHSWEGVGGAATFTFLGWLMLSMDVEALGEERLLLLDRAGSALRTRTIIAEPGRRSD
jgi:hypothetical protein